jgi:hypothetical protein
LFENCTLADDAVRIGPVCGVKFPASTSAQ